MLFARRLERAGRRGPRLQNRDGRLRPDAAARGRGRRGRRAARPRRGAAVRAGAAQHGPADRAPPGRRLHARRHGHRRREQPPRLPEGRLADRPRRAQHLHGLDRQGARQRRRQQVRHRRRADLWWQWLQHRVSGREAHERRQDLSGGFL